MTTPTVLHTRLGDNYIYLLLDRQDACVIDPTAAEPVEKLLYLHNLKLKLILNTHHHFDHMAGNETLKNLFGCPIVGSSGQIPSLSHLAKQGDRIEFGAYHLEVMATPGHTRDSLCYYWPGRPGLLFTGDTLFIGGCGRVMDGNATQLWSSLKTLASLPEDTLVYPGHEYTLDNYRFLIHQRPDDPALQQQQGWLAQKLSSQNATIPSTIGDEKRFNLFMRSPSLEAFAELRHLKDQFQ